MTTPTTESAWVHPFERAGLGQAPFRITGFSISVYQACHGAPVQPGSSCDFCGTAIKNVIHVTSSDGKTFKVGCDCVTRTNDTALSQAARRAERTYWYEARTIEQRAAAAERARLEAIRRAAVAESNLVEFELFLTACDAITTCDRTTEYQKKIASYLATALRDGVRAEGPSEDEADHIAAALRIVAAPVSMYYGKAGERVRGIDVVYEGGPSFETQFGTKRIANFRVVGGPNDGAILVWMTTSAIGWSDDNGVWRSLEIGEACTITGTVTKHGSYRGALQTHINRVKLSRKG